MGRIPKWMLVVLASLVCVPILHAQQSSVSNDTSVAGSVPRLVRFSGTLPDRRGASPASPAARVTFSIYEEQSGGAALWNEIQDVRLDAQGRYSVLLGAASSDGLPTELFSTSGARWLGVQVEGRQEESRVLLVAVPYALKAADADTLGGKPATAFVASDQLKDQVRDEVTTQVTQSGSATRTLVGTAPAPQAIGEGKSSFLCNVTTDCVTVTQSGTGVGLRATTPTGSSVLGELSGTTGAAVYGRATAGTGAASAVQGDAAAPNAVGVLGRAFGTTGTSTGVFGRSFSTSGIGVRGDATTATGATRGVWGTTASTGGVGVYGQSSAATGITTGVTGTVASTTGVGVLGIAYGASGPTIGVQAKVQSGDGTALFADNTAGGKIISGRVGGFEKVSIDGTGSLALAGNATAAGYITALGKVTGLNIKSSPTYNTSIGEGTLASITSGSSNTAAGAFALDDTTTGSRNIAVGLNAGYGNVAGSDNTFLGYGTAPYFAATLTNATAIGARSLVYTSNSLILGSLRGLNGAGSGVNVGIGTGVPIDLLHVETGENDSAGPGPVDSGITIKGTTLTYGDIGLKIHNTGTGGVNWFIDSTNNGSGYGGGILAFVPIGGSYPVLTLKAGEGPYVGIGIGPNPPYPLTICYTCGAGLADDWVTFSSRRFKTDIETLPNALATVERLRGVTYRDKSNGKAEIGVIAEEVAEVLPEVVGVGKDGKVDGVSYARLTALLIEATKEQQAQIRKLRRQAAAKDGQIRKLTQRVDELQRVDRRTALLEARLARLENAGGASQTASAAPAARGTKPRPGSTLAKVQF